MPCQKSSRPRRNKTSLKRKKPASPLLWKRRLPRTKSPGLLLRPEAVAAPARAYGISVGAWPLQALKVREKWAALL